MNKMSYIIKLQGLPLEANSVDVRLYFLGLTIPDGGVHIVGGDQGTVFIEFASDEDARQAMARGVGTIKNSNIKLHLSSRSEMQSVIDSIHLKHQQFLQQQQHQQQQQQQQHLQQQQQQQPQFQHPSVMAQQMQPWFGLPQQQQLPPPPPPPPHHHQVPLLPWLQQAPQPGQQPQPLLPQHQTQTNTTTTTNALLQNQQQQLLEDQQFSLRDRARMSGMRGGDDKLFADRRCVLAASNIPYRATSKDIIEFLSDFDIKEDNIRRRYNQKGQPTADAKIAFPTPDAAMKAMKMMNKKTICGRTVFLKPV